MATSRAGASRASARPIDASDLRIAWTSGRPISDAAFASAPPGAEATGESYYAAGAGLGEGAGHPAEPSEAALSLQE
jgi:hypothetical protein